MPEKFLFLDTETTGLKEPRLVALAYSLDNEEMINYGMFKPVKPIEPGATFVNGITNEMVAKKPLFIRTADSTKLQLLLETHTMVSHNVSFDARVLENEGLKVGKTLCTKELARQYISDAPNHKLQTLRMFLKLNCEAVAHNAYGDVIILKALFQKILKKAPHLAPHLLSRYNTPDTEFKIYHTTSNSIQTQIEIPTTLTA